MLQETKPIATGPISNGRATEAESAVTRTAIDLFAGAGGSSAGLRAAGFDVLAAIELDPEAGMSYAANHPETRLHIGDVRLANPAAFLEDLGIAKGQLGLLVACPPCQSFSTLGSGDADDPRNDLIFEVWRFVQSLRPAAFLLENVPGIARDGRLASFVRSCRGAGYGVRSYRVNAPQFGVPQRRIRHIVVGVADVRSALFPADLRDLLPVNFDAKPSTAGEALAMVKKCAGDPVSRHRSLQATTLARVKAIPVGGNRFDLPQNLILACHANLERRGATGSYGRIRAEELAPTMTTRCTTPSCGPFIHPTEPRGLTLREAAALQTFPPDYVFVGHYGSIERQIGNAVPVRMAEALSLAAWALVGLARAVAGTIDRKST